MSKADMDKADLDQPEIGTADSESEQQPTASLPAHRLKGIAVGDRGVQLLVSTKNHLYDAEDVHAGEDAYQVIGAWEEGSVSELGKLLNQRQAALNRETVGTARFGTTYGTGKKLGSVEEGTRKQPAAQENLT
ncbi:hypothetical protein NM208_g9075 [Fusarium decemcellulare]|uniref:Uncharacterized protein n=1 Tax=Fusarium decemcellulare TaxID=57161 RepID=A0ACC1S2X4_9HYPO|nr:hypothetical protein NM208_g9075 [Fusarium decemcellulare]